MIPIPSVLQSSIISNSIQLNQFFAFKNQFRTVMQTSDISMSNFHQKEIRNFFILVSFTNLLVNLDHGIVPAASIQIQSSLALDNEAFGLLGSLVYAGTVFMGLVASYLFLKQTSMVVMIFSLFSFTMEFDTQWAYFACRFCTGAAQAPLIVYFPVWVDTFGGENKTVWLTYLQSGVPVGVFFGYVLSSVISNRWNWRWAFYLQIAFLIPCTIYFSRQPNIMVDVRPHMKSKENEFQRMSYWKLLRIILKNKPYFLLTIALGFLYFTVTGIQFWITNYLIIVLKVDQVLVNSMFSFDSITGPISGCILAGIITQRVGGYDSFNANYVIFVAAVFGSTSSLLVPHLDNFWVLAGVIWVVLFCGGALVPVITGMILSSVNEGLRSFANSNTTTYVNLFGYLPAPIIYGYLTTVDPRLGMNCLMMCPAIGFIFMCFSMYFSYKNGKQLVEKSEHSLEQHQGSGRSSVSKVEEIQRRFRSQSEDLVAQVFDFHAIPISAKIGTNLNYEIQ